MVVVGGTVKQARILQRYCTGLLQNPLLAAEVTRSTDETVEFRNGAAVEIVTNDAGSLRGRSAIAIIGTESSHWTVAESSSSSDEEVVGALEPSLAMAPHGGLMIMSSTVFRKRGYMYRRFQELHGADDAPDDELCWLSPSQTMNPVLPESVIKKAFANDPVIAKSEFLSVWREDSNDFISADILEHVTDWGVRERPYQHGVRYQAFVDAAGGSGKDSFTLAIGHLEKGGIAVLDVLRERKPRFAAASVVEEFAALAKSYRIKKIVGDNYSGSWHADEWSRRGFRYEKSTLVRSALYIDCLPILLSERCLLLDIPDLRRQFSSLERRVLLSGKEVINHGQGASAHDDLCNSVAGMLVLVTAKRVLSFVNSANIFDGLPPKNPYDTPYAGSPSRAGAALVAWTNGSVNRAGS